MIHAIILAAGQSKRMGQPKMLLPWGKITVLEHVISVFAKAEVEDILVVTGGAHEQVEAIVEGCKRRYPVRSVYNERYEDGGMLSSIQCGLRAITVQPLPPFGHLPQIRQAKSSSITENAGVGFGGGWEGVVTLIGLGDQPQVEERSVRLVMDAYARTKSPLVVPSHMMRRGHPWLVARQLWDELLGMSLIQTPRDFLSRHAGTIQYVNVETPDVLADLDTPDDYRAARP